MKYLSLIIRYYTIISYLDIEKLNMTPNRFERVMFMCNEEMKKRKRRKLFGSKVYFSFEGNLEIPYISRIVRISPLVSQPTGLLSLVFVVNKTHINYMKKLLKLPENEFDEKFEKAIDNYCKHNKVRTYSRLSYKKWIFMGRNKVYGQVHPIVIIIWGFLLLFLPFFIFIFLILSYYATAFSLTVFMLLFSYVLFGKKSVFATGMLGNDDDTFLSLESYKKQLKALKKEGKIRNNRF